MRLVAGITLISRGIVVLTEAPQLERAILHVLSTGTGLLLLAGLWTPIAGTLVATLNLWNTFSQPGDPWIHILLGTLGIALALIGPGAWSADARLFGWKRIHISGLAD